MKIAIINDHTGYELKKFLVENLSKKYEIIDLGVGNVTVSNYAQLGLDIGEYIRDGKANLGIAICGSGIGISIAANKVDKIMCALCNDVLSGRFAKIHNNANIIALGARFIGTEHALYIVNEFLNYKFEGSRHVERINTILNYKNQK